MHLHQCRERNNGSFIAAIKVLWMADANQPREITEAVQTETA